MYSPKIKEDLIPRLYRFAKAQRRPMTRVVNQLLEVGLAKLEQETAHDPGNEFEQPSVQQQRARSEQ